MSIRVDFTYDMSKALGVRRIDVEDARTVRDLVQEVQSRFEGGGDDFAKLTRVASVAVNGVLISHRRGMRTRLSDGDRVTFVKAAAGG